MESIWTCWRIRISVGCACLYVNSEARIKTPTGAPYGHLMDLRRELKELEANLRCYEDLIKSHDKHVEEATQKILEAKEVLRRVLHRYDIAPVLIQQTKMRIKAMKVQVSSINFRPDTVDPRFKRLLALKAKLRELENDLGL